MPTTRTVTFVLATTLALAPLAACAQSEPEPQSQQAAADEAAAVTDLISGTWNVSPAELNDHDALDAQDLARFEQATNTFAPRTFAPRLLMATRGDKDKDYAYLCTTRSDATDLDSWAIACVHEPAQGEASITLFHKIDLTHVQVLPHVLQDLTLGDWSLVDPHGKTCMSDDEAIADASADDNAIPSVSHNPVAVLGIREKPTDQSLYLTWGTSDNDKGASKAWYVRVVEREPSHQTTVIDTKALDLLAYLQE
ncbi:MAG: hypothetical protein Q4A01_10125 [Coriobacteriales bacterium]|nr:hypothetical protein [Coriobacteriales bacterium]